MKKIDPETVQRILDSADIVEVVSDYVNLKRRGANYTGLCPFHNERTPSFSVSKAKGICKCFSCGKGGSPVNFIMEIEQVSYQEALRHLARKYNIEIKERELTDKERQDASDRESLFAVNELALKHFRHNLTDTDDGRDIGLTYFRERGINDWAIERFNLGYSMPARTSLYDEAIARGYNERFLIESGLCIKADSGQVYDRFRGRVMYPIFTVSGKVVGFGGRTLRKDKDVAKYVNSPESKIYRKSYELYGLYQARHAIAKADRCILVEGYMDVISMHQSGVENVVASSGTSLTDGQIRLIHRFTPHITVIYDSDPAGIKASLRGIDMILAEGMDVKVVLLPDGDDPDSFAQSHTTEQILDYLQSNATDFITFKTRILLQGVENDPIARARVITDIVQSISVIPDMITRTVYIRECSLMLGIDEKVLTLQVEKFYNNRRDQEALKLAKAQAQKELAEARAKEEAKAACKPATNVPEQADTQPTVRNEMVRRYERRLLRYVVKYAMVEIMQQWDESGGQETVLLVDYIKMDLDYDGLKFTEPLYDKIFELVLSLRRSSWETDYEAAKQQLLQQREDDWRKGVEDIRLTADDFQDIERSEKLLNEALDSRFNEAMRDFAAQYVEKRLISTSDDQVRQLATDLVSEKYQLSKVHTRFAKVETEVDRLREYVDRALFELKDAIIQSRIRDLRERIRVLSGQPERDDALLMSLMRENAQLAEIRSQFAKQLGERIVAPRK